MKLYHEGFEGHVDCHPSQVDNMKRKGWSEEPIDTAEADQIAEADQGEPADEQPTDENED